MTVKRTSSPWYNQQINNDDENITARTLGASVCRSLARVSNPQGRNPHQLTIVLLAADIVITCLAFLRLVIAPRESHVLSIGRARIHVLAIPDDADLSEPGCAAQPDLQ